MTYSAEFRCLAGCAGSFPVTQSIYRCPSCGGLLEVVHDVEALRERGPEEWKALFDQRWMKTSWPYGSGVWGKREWVLPMVPDELIVSMYEGGTNLFWAERYGKQLGLDDLWVKLCGNSHSGSFKDLGMTVLVSAVRLAISQGSKIQAVACASTGDTSAALAAYGAAAGLPVVVLLPRGKISTGQLVQPLAHGALVLGLDTDFDGCMEIVQRLAEEGLVYLANSMNALRLEGQKTVAVEIVQQFDWQVPDWVILPSGNLGNASALHAGFKMMRDLGIISRYPRLVMAQAENANPLYRAVSAGKDHVDPIKAQPTQATAIQIGNPVSAPRALRALSALNGLVEQASEQELADAAARADRTGLYTCPHTAVALASLEKLVSRGVIAKGDRVVVVSTANGLKFTEFKVRYHEGTIDGVTSNLANPPVMLPADYGQVVDAIRARLS
ncbi:MAG: threonine synthase [Myxococcales bacterium]|nr:threonine synthase [Myxococcales bacterium]MCB9576190.1 threonine synthase [Polyangiaceae bacterium]